MEISDPKKKSGAIQGSRPYRLEELVEYQDGTIVSKTLTKGSGGTLTVFAFDRGQELSEHSAPFDAYVTVLDGEAVLTIGGSDVVTGTGQTVLMPADVPHAVRADIRFKMLLTMLRHND